MIEFFKKAIRTAKQNREHRQNVKRFKELCGEIDALIAKQRKSLEQNSGFEPARFESLTERVAIRREMLNNNLKPPVDQESFDTNLKSLRRNFASLDYIVNHSEL